MLKKNYKEILLIFIVIVYQSISYLIAKLSPFSTTVLDTGIYNNIPFVPYFIYFYIIWYIMLFFVPLLFLIKSKDNFFKYITTLLISITICFIIYIFFPTMILRDNILVNNFSTLLISLIYSIDTPALNCLPSMHCLISFLFIMVSINDKKINLFEKLTIIILSILVILSTLFIRQHVLCDIVTAFLIASAIYFLVIIKGIDKKIFHQRK